MKSVGGTFVAKPQYEAQWSQKIEGTPREIHVNPIPSHPPMSENTHHVFRTKDWWIFVSGVPEARRLLGLGLNFSTTCRNIL